MSDGGATVATVLRVAEIGGRGRGLVAAEPLQGGQVVLRDSPLLLYSAFPFLSSGSPYCDHCFRLLASAFQKCPSCSLAFFCSPNCLASHTLWLCESMRRLRHCSAAAFSDQPPERQVQARFLLAAYNLAAVCPSDFQVLLSLQGDGGGDSTSPADAATAGFLHSLLASVCPPLSVSMSPEFTAALLAKDKFNAFGLMEPFSPSEEKRSVRAYGIYPKASLFNHDCLPNACRFDYLDSASDGNTDVIIRMIHDVPEGREVCLSYFPVNMNYSCRQRRLLEGYGFTCDCDRCKVEASWSDNEEEDEDEAMDVDDDDEDEQRMVGPEGENEEACGSGEDESDFPHAYFFVRYMCNRENCWGTLAPVPPTDGSSPSTILECNVCSNLKEDEVGANQ